MNDSHESGRASDSLNAMVLISGGIFQMGSEHGEIDEKPLRYVTLSDFYLGKYEVTVAEFKKFVSDTGHRTDAEKNGSSWVYVAGKWVTKPGIHWRFDPEGKPANDHHPVVHVSWNDAQAYCAWLSKKTGLQYRLPTEAEWEYAAGNGTRHTTFSWGNEMPFGLSVGNLGDETAANCFQWVKTPENIFPGYTDGFKTTAPVGSFLPNDFGLYDMTGNVWEWCSDWYCSYPNENQTNPTGPGSGQFRVVRGGSWYRYPQFCRVSYRLFDPPDYRNFLIGFRVARNAVLL